MFIYISNRKPHRQAFAINSTTIYPQLPNHTHQTLKMPHITLLAHASSAPAPGWAYIPESTYIDPSKAAINPSGARARHKPAASTLSTAQGSSELSARQRNAIQRRIQELDRDAPVREVVVASGGRGAGGGKTQGTRRILGSQKGWRNWLDDEEAMVAGGAGRGREEERRKSGLRGKDKARETSVSGSGTATPTKDGEGAAGAEMKGEGEGEDATMVDAPTAVDGKDDDDEPLLRVETLAPLEQSRIEALLSQPPLSYNAARAAPPDANAPPQRHFCEICGYWGRARCIKCGSRVCGLDCKITHDVECGRRFA